MGITESNTLIQLKKGQGETNERLDRVAQLVAQLVQEQQRTNQLLEWVGKVAGAPRA